MSTAPAWSPLERAVLQALTGRHVDVTRSTRDRLETPGGWHGGRATDFDSTAALDVAQLWAFLSATQFVTDEERQTLDLSPESPSREPFLAALAWEVERRGVVDVLRRGMSYGSRHILLFYAASPPYGSLQLFSRNRFSVTPRLRFNETDAGDVLDCCLFVNGLPIMTIKLADQAEQALAWYRSRAKGSASIFQPGHCLAHLAVDEHQAYFSADLDAPATDFLPFNRGANDAEGNPSRLFGLATEYIWQRILTRRSVADLIEHYAGVIVASESWARDQRPQPIFPRYHQLDLVRTLLADIGTHGVGQRYLLQHAAGSGKSMSIVWLVSQLLDLEQVEMATFGTVIIVTSRPASERLLPETIRQFAQMSAIVDARDSTTSRIEEMLHSPSRIVLVDVKDFAFVLHEITEHFHGYGYALVIDESTGAMEDQINAAMAEWGPRPNASYFVFTATPNERTGALFGLPYNDRGVIKYRPFHQFG